MTVTPFKRPNNKINQPRAINIPPYTLALCALMVAVYMACFVMPQLYIFAFVPAHLLAGQISAFFGLLGYSFLHASFMHLAMNLVMLVALGTAIEQVLGGKRMLALCLLGAVAGAFAQTLANWGGMEPMVGASAAIGGLFGAYVMLQPTQQARRQMAIALGLVFVGSAFLFGAVMGGDSIAWAAHLGGMLAGMAQTGLWLGRRL